MRDLSPFQMPLGEALSTQRAIRRVRPEEPVEDELLLQLIEFGTRAPNSMNKQSWEFILVRDPAVKAKLGWQNRFMWNRVKGSMNKKGESDSSFQKVNRATQWGVDHFEEYPALIVACFRGSGRSIVRSVGCMISSGILIRPLTCSSRRANWKRFDKI